MSGEIVQVESGRVTIGLKKFQFSLQRKEEMLRAIGGAMLVSIYRTFRDQGSPAGSWVPLSPNTIKRNPRKYGAGHKLLIDSGALRNSITYAVGGNGVSIGTNLVYAGVHQFGSRDRGTAIGPQTLAESKAVVQVKAGSYYRKSAELGVGKMNGRRMKIKGPRNAAEIKVGAHTRHQNIPPRPYLVFRPEDPERIRRLVVAFANKSAKDAGLGGAP